MKAISGTPRERCPRVAKRRLGDAPATTVTPVENAVPLHEPLQAAKWACSTVRGRRAQAYATTGSCDDLGTNEVWWPPGTSNPWVGGLRRPRWVRFPRVPAT